MDATLIIAAANGHSPAAPSRFYGIHLKISPAAREDAWDLCRVLLRYGGMEVSDCCFAFLNEERWSAALEALRFQFGPEYFEAVDPVEPHHT